MQFSLRQLIATNRLLIGAVIVSLLVTFLHTPLLNGTFGGLVVTVIAQLYLPGYLVARAVGKHRLPHPISRFAWVLAGGLGLTVCLGAAARLLNLPVPVYLVILYGIMFVLALLPAPTPSTVQPWRLTRKNLPLYVAVAVSCVVVFGVSYESRHRFFGFEDQPIFISLVDWLAQHPDERPHDLPLRSRQIGGLNADTRSDTDGWSYNQAAWVWASGVPARQIVWYDLGTLFIWAVPLLTFALAYQLTEREDVAAASAIALMLVGLLTLDNIVYHPSYTAFGRFAVFQINVLRQMSITIMLPLALLTALAYMQSFARRDLVIALLAGVALAAMHPIQIMIFVMSIAITALVSWLARPTRVRLMQLLPLILLVIVLLTLPFVQRLNRRGLGAADTLISLDNSAEETTSSNGYFTILRDLPLVGTTFIRNPASVFYSPAITLAVILGLACGWWRRRGLAAQYIFGTTLLALMIFFTPGLTELFNKVASSLGVLTTMFMIPVPLAYGVGLCLIGEAVFARRQSAIRFLQSEGFRWLAALAFVLVAGALLFEPFPIPASARDQLRAYNDMQALRYLHPAQAALASSLGTHLPQGEISVLTTPYDVANVVIEDHPDTLITGGRSNRNLASDGNNRFMNEGGVPAPWLDTTDLDFLVEWSVTHIITLADTTRLPQMLLQPERFERLDTPSGYVLFRLKPDITAEAIDALYSEMNAVYATMEMPRWGRDGFNLILPGDPDAWRPFVGRWQRLLDENPADDRARLGLAFTYLMMGEDDEALPLWEALHEQYPDVPLYADALASTLQVVDPAADSITSLMEGLRSDYDAVRVLAARRLLTDTFFYRLDEERLAQVVGVMQTDSVTWDRLANLGQQQPIRERAALLMNAGQWAAAGAELDALPHAEFAPEDLMARAAIQLVQGNVLGALDILKPATDADQIAANVFLHGDRWEDNTAAWAYYLIQAELVGREGREADKNAAIQAAARYQGELTDGQRSLLSLIDTQAVYVMQPDVARSDERTLTVTATYGDVRPREAYPIQSWRIQVVSPDSATKYAERDVTAQLLDGVLVESSVELLIPADVPALTSALVIIEPRYNDAVTTIPAILPIVLNRPDSASIPADATPAEFKFGDHITLQAAQVSYEDGRLEATLYWQTDSALAEDYQVFVHVLDAEGQQVGGGDGAPVNNQYPTSQWRTGVTIADPRTITFDSPLPPGEYTVRIGLYRLSSGERLTVSPTSDTVYDNSVTVYQFGK